MGGGATHGHGHGHGGKGNPLREQGPERHHRKGGRMAKLPPSTLFPQSTVVTEKRQGVAVHTRHDLDPDRTAPRPRGLPGGRSTRRRATAVGRRAQAHVFGTVGRAPLSRMPKTESEADPYTGEADAGTGGRGAPAPRCVPAGEASSALSDRSPPPPFPPRVGVHARVAGPVAEPPAPAFPLPCFNTDVGRRCPAARGGRHKGSGLPSASRSPTTGPSTSRRRAPAGSVRVWERRAGGRGSQAPEDDR